MLCAGEALEADLRDRFFARFGPDRELHNLYGPTDATVTATHHRCQPDDGPGPVSIGRPMANVTAHVLDDRLEPLPVGIPGELYLGGACVARGYLDDSGRTAERFVPDPFATGPGARLYQTGDRARRQPDGSLVFLGRLDRQVKLHGIRIEPGEIEAALRRHRDVREAVVEPRGDGAGGHRLVAYVVSTSPGSVDAPGLRAVLKDELPAHLIPSAFVLLPRLPRTPAGKLDRRALPEPDAAALRGTGRAYVAPRDGLERRLVAVWEDVFAARPIGVRDDFFDLGGHSLMAVTLFTRISERFGRGTAAGRIAPGADDRGACPAARSD